MSEPVPSITSAQEPLAVDQARRTRSYLIQMSIRVVCIIGAVLVDGWIRWALVAAAVVLPYSAVLVANAGREHTTHDTSPVTPQAAPMLEELPEEAPPAARQDGQSGQSGPADGRSDDAGAHDGTGRLSPGSGRVINHVDD